MEEHYLELDLGKLEKTPKQLTLFLTGWIYPTNTSINVNLSQQSDLPIRKLPSLWVPDGNGEWKPRRASWGSPAARPRRWRWRLTPASFRQGDYRVRVVTSAEIYWDDVFFTVDEPAGRAERNAARACLRPSALPRLLEGAAAGSDAPQLYDYSQVEQSSDLGRRCKANSPATATSASC